MFRAISLYNWKILFPSRWCYLFGDNNVKKNKLVLVLLYEVRANFQALHKRQYK